MENRAAHGEIRTQVLYFALQNPGFTVPELCARTGLSRDQVYPLLADLLKAELLVKKEIKPPAGTKRAPHRPLVLYQLSTDVEKRRELASKVAPFLRMFAEKSTPSRNVADALIQSDRALDRVDKSLDQFEESFQAPLSVSLVSAIDRGLSEADRSISLASAQARDIDVYDDNSRKWRSDQFDRVSTYSDRVRKLRFKLHMRATELEAQADFAKIISSFDPDTIRRNPSSFLAAISERQARESNWQLQRSLADCSNKLRTLERFSGRSTEDLIVLVLAECMLRFGSDGSAALQLAKRFQGDRSWHAYRYNMLNLNVLTSRGDDATAIWNETMRVDAPVLAFAAKRVEHQESYRYTAAFTAPKEAVTTEVLSEVQRKLRTNGSVSVVSASPVNQFATEAFVVKPTLASWLETNTDPSGFVLSTSIRTNVSNMFAYGPIVEGLQIPGVPMVRLAATLHGFHFDFGDAWNIATRVGRHNVIVFLHNLSALDSAAILRSTFGTSASLIAESAERMARLASCAQA